MASCISTATGNSAGGNSISDVHPDIIQTHILTCLDGLTLAAISSTSSQLHALSAQDHLWRDICTSTWPSVRYPLVHHLISTFPSGYRSFFSDSFPFPDHRPCKEKLRSETITTDQIVSAVDIYYQGNVIYSTVEETQTSTSSFLESDFHVGLVDPKESVPTRIRKEGEDDEWMLELEENLTVSWILIDPRRKRAVSLSSRRPVTAEKNWSTGEQVQLRFSTIIDTGRGSDGLVELAVVVTFGRREGGEVQVCEMSMQAADMDGRSLRWRESLEILDEVMEGGRKKEGKNGEGKARYQEFVERKKKKKEMMQRKEGALDIACRVLDMACVVLGAAVFATFWNSASFW